MKIRQRNSRFLYYAANLLRFSLPAALCRRRRDGILASLERFDRPSVLDRVDYYNRLSRPFRLDPAVAPFRFSLAQGRRNYHMDLYEYTRYFAPAMKVQCRFGDQTDVPAHPLIVKARPIAGDNANSVLFNLNKIRHFVFPADRLSFAEKADKLVWRGNASRENRRRFLEQYFRHERCDVGHAHHGRKDNPWTRKPLGITAQLKYKFILSLEGNDVASNLKWILASNSLCFMPRPRCETWFMEGRLVPGVHYVPLRDDFSDLPAQMDYYASHAPEALEIIRNAHAHVDRFRDPAMEDLVSLLVLKKYFELSGQWT